MQNAALAAVGLVDWRYQLLPVRPELFAETVPALAPAGFRGANVTLPHKQAALALAGGPTPRARAIGAANTLIFEDNGEIRADNTDAPALVNALPFAPAGRTATVLGAGGSARSAVWALLDAGASDVRVWNRTPAGASQLGAELGGTPVKRIEPADLLVNCTSVGLRAGDLPFEALPLSVEDLGHYSCVVDFVYGESETLLVRAAREREIAVVDGLALLLGQGALSFELFTGRTAPIDAMRAALQTR